MSKDKKVVDKPLTTKQDMFCREYIIDLNGTQAAIRAGYSVKGASQQASVLLANPKVSARIKELKDNRADELELDAYWVLKRLKDISDRAMQAEPVMQFDAVAGEMVETGEYEFDSNGANRATELIGRHIGMFDPKLKHQLDSLKLSNDKKQAEIDMIREKIKLFTGEGKDTGMLNVLMDALQDKGE